jgi:ABC-type taurine transport system substrate-binding protein
MCIIFRSNIDVAQALAAASRIPNLVTLSLVGCTSSALPINAFADLPAFDRLETLVVSGFHQVKMTHVVQLAQIRAPRLSTIHWQSAFVDGAKEKAVTALVVALVMRQGPTMTLAVSDISHDIWDLVMSNMVPPMNTQLKVVADQYDWWKRY